MVWLHFLRWALALNKQGYGTINRMLLFSHPCRKTSHKKAAPLVNLHITHFMFESTWHSSSLFPYWTLSYSFFSSYYLSFKFLKKPIHSLLLLVQKIHKKTPVIKKYIYIPGASSTALLNKSSCFDHFPGGVPKHGPLLKTRFFPNLRNVWLVRVVKENDQNTTHIPPPEDHNWWPAAVSQQFQVSLVVIPDLLCREA